MNNFQRQFYFETKKTIDTKESYNFMSDKRNLKFKKKKLEPALVNCTVFS